LHRGSRQFFETCGTAEQPLAEEVQQLAATTVPWRPMFKLQVSWLLRCNVCLFDWDFPMQCLFLAARD
jgi:hypothetical protein